MTHTPPPTSQPPTSWQPVPAPAPAPTSQQRPAAPLPWILLAAFIAATVVFAVLFFTGVGSHDDPAATGPATTELPATSIPSVAEQREEQRVEVIRVAEEVAVLMSTFDYTNINANSPAVLALSTDAFGSKYTESLKALQEVVVQGKSHAEATVSHSAVAAIDENQATVLLFLDQKSFHTTAPDGRDQNFRMVMTLKRADGRWLVDTAETV